MQITWLMHIQLRSEWFSTDLHSNPGPVLLRINHCFRSDSWRFGCTLARSVLLSIPYLSCSRSSSVSARDQSPIAVREVIQVQRVLICPLALQRKGEQQQPSVWIGFADFTRWRSLKTRVNGAALRHSPFKVDKKRLHRCMPNTTQGFFYGF